MSTNAISTLISGKNKGIIPIGKEGNAYCITSYTGNDADASINCLIRKKGIFLTEEPIDSKELIKSVFEDEDEQAGIYFSNNDVECIINEGPSLLVQLYMLFDDISCNKKKLMSVIVKLIVEGGYHPEDVIFNLLSITRQEISELIKEEDVIEQFKKLIKK